MAKTAMVQARIEPELKSEVEKILRTLGLNTTYAIGVFFRQIKLNKGIPFAVEIPNKETRKAIAEARAGKGKKFNSTKELFDELQR
jgi:DNA-damage-inducible protein J